MDRRAFFLVVQLVWTRIILFFYVDKESRIMVRFDLEYNWEKWYLSDYITLAGARGVMVIVVGNEHGDTSSNPGRNWLHFT